MTREAVFECELQHIGKVCQLKSTRYSFVWGWYTRDGVRLLAEAGLIITVQKNEN